MVRESGKVGNWAMKSIHDVLEELREASFNERHKGDLFEALTKKFLEIDPFYGSYFDKVWLYGEWATQTKLSKQDTGIDLVARIAETGEIAAIQCKFYAEGAYLDKKEIDSFFTASGKKPFRERYIFSTTDNWSKNASDAVEGQQIPATIVRVQDLDASGIDWSGFSVQDASNLGLLKKKTPFPHQLEAIEAAKAHFASADRGKMIMACGTGKTFTSLQIVQEMTPKGGTVLFLVPSLALLSQTLKEWKREASVNFRAYAVCSDSKLSKQASTEDTRVADLAYPSTTNVEKLASHFGKGTDAELTVIFSTYQSIEVVAAAQEKGVPEFDLIICDEAHRTTGVTLAGDDESNFVRVHDKNFIKGSKRLYMTATPRIYAEASKAKAEEASAVLASMDNESQFGQEFHRLNFGNAVSRGLLSDYKVLVLTVSETQVSKSLQKLLTDGDELKLQDAIKIVGCYNGLRKRSTNPDDFIVDKTPMRTAVAFSRSIKDSKRIAELFGTVTKALNDEAKEKDALIAEADHVDGTFNVMARNERLDWLKDTKTENTVRVLSNARCLTEGVDVPALDAVLFLNPRDSQVDVVQSVGRVMRKAEGKQYGYVILPIAVPAGKSAEDALADNKNYKVVWQVLQALRAHDERFDALVNKIDLTGDTGGVIEIIDASPGAGEGEWDGDSKPKDNGQVPLFEFDFADWKDAILAKIVQKVGERTYWENWAKDVAEIAKNHISRIEHLVNGSNANLELEFKTFLKGLQDNLNPGVSKSDAIEMLAQHLITKPVFDALFEGYDFTSENPVSVSMQRMVNALETASINKESEDLEGFYASVRLRAAGITDGAAKQKIVKELYEKFFRLAFSGTSEKLGVVYTPNEIVDFIIHSVDVALNKEFGAGLGSEGVHVLDPFTGTGTFIVRLLQSGLISKEQLEAKFSTQLHANEIVLLAYYVAAINIEETYQSIIGKHEPFQGIVLTDTFQMTEGNDSLDSLGVFPDNNDRVIHQNALDIRVVIGNPPYSMGQKDANDNNQNLKYEDLDSRIASTYVKESSSVTRTSVYDSYIRAFRWASDRIGDKGVVCFVTNGSWLDSNSADGMRKSLQREFSSLYLFNLRGNARLQGVQRKAEGGGVFGEGSRTPVAIALLIKNPESQDVGKIFYHDIGDFLTREEKLEVISTAKSFDGLSLRELSPNSQGDWLSQRNPKFDEYIPIGDRNSKGVESETIFKMYTKGVVTNRDVWTYNFSKAAVLSNMGRSISFYNDLIRRSESEGGDPSGYVTGNKDKISWVANLINDFKKKKSAALDPNEMQLGNYRPFTKQWVYKQRQMVWSPYKTPVTFPPSFANKAIAITGPGAVSGFAALGLDLLPNFDSMDHGQVFPLFYIPESVSKDTSLFDSLDSGPQYAITDWALGKFASELGFSVTKPQIFYYVYAVLNHPEYKTMFATDLKRQLPRVPVHKDFLELSTTGERLFELHIQYEEARPHSTTIMNTYKGSDLFENFRVEKMTYGKSGDRSQIVVNRFVTLTDIPEGVFGYMVGGKSGVDWVLDRYRVTVDKDSGIVNDPNLYSEKPDYIFNLLLNVMELSLDTIRIIRTMPSLNL
jgi:predicted helicase